MSTTERGIFIDEEIGTIVGNAEQDKEMNSREVASPDWFDYFARFNREHRGKLSTLRTLSPGFVVQIEARNLPLEGIVSSHSTTIAITIGLGRGLHTHIEHTVPDPIRVWVQFGVDGREVAIDIESTDGTKTILEILQGSPAKTA